MQIGGFARGVDKSAGYGVSSLRLGVAWAPDSPSLSAHAAPAARECCPGCGRLAGAGCQGTGQMTAARVVWCAVTVTDSGNEHGFSHSVPLSSWPLSVTAAPLLSVSTDGDRAETR